MLAVRPALRRQDVGRLDVAVDEAARVSGVERARRPEQDRRARRAGSSGPSRGARSSDRSPRRSASRCRAGPRPRPARRSGTMLGWSIEAASRDSRRKRSRNRSSWASSRRAASAPPCARGADPRPGRRRHPAAAEQRLDPVAGHLGADPGIVAYLHDARAHSRVRASKNDGRLRICMGARVSVPFQARSRLVRARCWASAVRA